MLEGLVAWVLNNYVGEYFENLNTDQLSIALLQGQVELENVPLKKTAFRKFDIPVQVKSGLIGKLTLTVPIHMRSEPWILKMSDVLILLSPSTSKYDVEFVEQYEQSRRQTMLNDLEQYHKKQLLLMIGESIKSDVSENQSQWWGASLVSNVTNNMQVILDNVHIRYEDVVTSKSGAEKFCFGIKVENITVQTTNSQWKPAYIQPDRDRQSNIFKKLNIRRLSIYWNFTSNYDDGIVENLTMSQLKRRMSPKSNKTDSYILQPFSMEARMEKNASKYPLKSLPLIPRFKFDLRPEKIEVDFSRAQLTQIRYLARQWTLFDRARQHRKWRPRLSILKDPQAWWRFASSRIMETNRKQRCLHNKNFVLTRLHYLCLYCRAYRRRLESFLIAHNFTTNVSAHSSAQIQEDVFFMKQLEHDVQFNYDELHLFRETVFRHFMQELGDTSVSPQDDDTEGFLVVDDKRPKIDSAINQVEPRTSKSKNIKSDEQSKHDNAAINSAPPSGWYDWISGWFNAPQSLEENNLEDDVNEALFLDLRPKIKERHLSPELKHLEEQMESELLDVLSESWDDSTILRRDTLLAELYFRLDHMVIRFLDSGVNNEFSLTACNRILILDMRCLTSRMQISPREHRMEISLSVEEMSAQRLQLLPNNLLSPNTSDKLITLSKTNNDVISSSSTSSYTSNRQKQEDDAQESLLYGFSDKNLEPELLLTVCRAGKNESGNEPKSRNWDGGFMANPSKMAADPILQLFYRRLAPKLDVYQEINVTLAPIFAMYEENALDGILNLFNVDLDDEKLMNFGTTNESTHVEDEDSRNIANSRLFLTVDISKILVELRRRKSTLIEMTVSSPNDIIDGDEGGVRGEEYADANSGQASHPFALVSMRSVNVSYISTEPYTSKLRVLFHSLLIEDLFEPNCHWPLVKSVSAMSSVYEDKTITVHEGDQKKSRSWPTLSNCDDSDEYKTSSLCRGCFSSLPDLERANAPKKLFADQKLFSEKENGICRQSYLKSGNMSSAHDRDWKMMSIVFADDRHPNFESEFNKKHCRMRGDFKDSIEFGVNRRTWVALLDFFGILGRANDDGGMERENTSCRNVITTHMPAYNFECRVKAKLAQLIMNYPSKTLTTQLGTCFLEGCEFKIELNLNDVEEPMLLEIASTALRITDSTPFYSQLYDERLLAARDPSIPVTEENMLENCSIFLKVLKHRVDDPLLQRDCDIDLQLFVPRHFSTVYVHTHRYFFAIFDFWMNFVELQYQVYKQNEQMLSLKRQNNTVKAEVQEQQKTRCKMAVNLEGGVDLVVPLNQHCDEVMLFTSTNFVICNSFIRASRLPVLVEHAIDLCGDVDDYDCLLDVMRIFCNDVRLYRAFRVPTKIKSGGTTKRFTHRQFGRTTNFYFVGIPERSVFHQDVNVNVDVFRNLSTLISHKMPDMVAVTNLADINLALSAPFYCLLRGMLEQNIGEQLTMQPETIPVELLQLPDRCETYDMGAGAKYATFCFRMILNNVQFYFSTQDDLQESSGAANRRTPPLLNAASFIECEPFGRMHLHSAKISFDSYVDNQYEMYLICQSMNLFDDRRPTKGSGNANGDEKKPLNVFTSILSANYSKSTSSANSKKKPSSPSDLMFEVHISVKKDEAPVITLVFLHARVMLIFDWLLRAKEFLFQTSAFVPPFKWAAGDSYLYEVPKEGILVRTISSVQPSQYYDPYCRRHQKHSLASRHTFTLKITLEDLDLVLVESPQQADSLALVCFTTGVFTANDLLGIFEANLELQKLSVSWCSMSGNNSKVEQKKLTNDFTATISLIRDVRSNDEFCVSARSAPTSHSNSAKSMERLKHASDERMSVDGSYGGGSGIYLIDVIHHRQKLLVELSDKVEAKLGDDSLRAIQQVLNGVAILWSTACDGAGAANGHLDAAVGQPKVADHKPATVNISKIVAKCSQLNVCYLMSRNKILMPFLRFVISDFHLDKNMDRLTSSFEVAVDSYNEVVFGFEPLIEPWYVERLAIQQGKLHLNVDIIPAVESVLNVNLTQTFVQQILRIFYGNAGSSSTESDAEGIDHLNQKLSEKLLSSTTSSGGYESFNVTFFVPAGVGVSLVSKRNEELIYLQFRRLKMHLLKQENTYQFNVHVDAVQADNQLLNAERWQFLYCESKVPTLDYYCQEMESAAIPRTPSAARQLTGGNFTTKGGHLRRGSSTFYADYVGTSSTENLPSSSTSASLSTLQNAMKRALSIEISFTPTSLWNTFEHFRVSVCDLSVLVDEILLWKMVQLVLELRDSIDAASAANAASSGNSLRKSKSLSGNDTSKSNFYVPPATSGTETENSIMSSSKKCYFNSLEIVIGNVSLSALAFGDNSLTPSLRVIKKQFGIRLMSFENALVSISRFARNQHITTFEELSKTLSEFYLSELKRQKLNIVITMDAFGNPLGLATDFRDSFEGLIYEGDLGGFVFGVGYGVTNSISKVASSMAEGVGFLTFDEQHEQMRRRMLRNQALSENATALSHLYGGVKGLGVGVFGGLTAIAKNTFTATQQEGVSGIFRGVTTGALDTVTKPLQGALDLLEGTASAFKEAVGGPSVRKSQFAEHRLRLPRVCVNLQSLLPPYSQELAAAQQQLLRINSFSTSETLLDVVTFLRDYDKEHFTFQALICSEQCYILRRIGTDPYTVAQRIAYKYLRSVQPARLSQSIPQGLVPIEVVESSHSSSKSIRGGGSETLWCMNVEVAHRLCNKIMCAKNLYEKSTRRSSTITCCAAERKASSVIAHQQLLTRANSTVVTSSGSILAENGGGRKSSVAAAFSKKPELTSTPSLSEEMNPSGHSSVGGAEERNNKNGTLKLDYW